MPSRRNIRILEGLLDFANDGPRHAGEKIFMPEAKQAAHDSTRAGTLDRLRSDKILDEEGFVAVDGADQRFPYVKKQVVHNADRDLVEGMASLADHDRVKYGAENMDCLL